MIAKPLMPANVPKLNNRIPFDRFDNIINEPIIRILSLNSRLFYFLVNFWEGPAELIEVQSISDDEVGTFEAAEFDIEVCLFVGSSNQNSDIDGFRFEFSEEGDYFFKSIAGVLHIFDDEDMLSEVIFGVEWSFQGELSCGLSASVGFGLDKLTVMVMFDQFDEIRVKHEGTFEYADYNKIDVTLFFPKIGIVLINLRC